MRCRFFIRHFLKVRCFLAFQQGMKSLLFSRKRIHSAEPQPQLQEAAALRPLKVRGSTVCDGIAKIQFVWRDYPVDFVPVIFEIDSAALEVSGHKFPNVFFIGDAKDLYFIISCVLFTVIAYENFITYLYNEGKINLQSLNEECAIMNYDRLKSDRRCGLTEHHQPDLITCPCREQTALPCSS